MVVWQEQRILLDGHNRYELCTKHNLPYRTVEISLPNIHAAKVRMIDNQLGRRNLTEGQMSYLRGERYKLEKQGHGGDRKSEEKSSSQNDHSIKTAEKLSTQYKVSPKTIQRDASYASDINAIAAVADTQGARIVMETEGKLGRKEVKALRDKRSGHTQGEVWPLLPCLAEDTR